MEIIRLDSAIRARGSEGGGEEGLALALATSMVPRLRRWAEAKARLDSDIWTLESKLEEWRSPLLAATRGSGEAATIEEERAKLEEQLLRLRTELRKVERRPWPYLRSVWMLIWGSGWRADQESAQRRLAEHESRLEDLSARLSGQVEELSRELEELRRERSDLDAVPEVVEGVRALDYVFLPRRVRRSGGSRTGKGVEVRWLLADPFGEPVTVDAPQTAMSAQELDELSRSLADLDLGSVMLKQPDSSPARDRPLLGAERQLAEASNGLSRFASTTKVRQLSLSVVPPGGSLATFLARGLRDTEVPGETVAPELDRESRTRLSEVRKSADELGAVARSNLHATPAVYSAFAAGSGDLPDIAARADSARERAAAVLAGQVRRARRNAAMVRYRMLCPECNAFPAYLAKAYGLTEDAVGELDTKRLRRALEELRDRRLGTKVGKELGPDERLALDQRWTDALGELESLEEACRFHQGELEEVRNEATSGDGNARLRHESAMREVEILEARYHEIVYDLQTNPLTLPDAPAPTEASSERDDAEGGPTSAPPLPLDSSTQLLYAPNDHAAPWSCRRCSTAFDEETARFGAVDRFRTDVLYPTLSSLWGHRIVRSGAAKALERAASDVAAKSEEEAALLEEPVAGFRADADRLRTQVEEAHARGTAVSRRLIKVAEQFARFGLLQAKELDQVRRSAQGTLDRMEEIRQALDRLAAAQRGMEDTIGAGRRTRAALTPPDRRFLDEDAARLTPLAELGHAPASVHGRTGPASSTPKAPPEGVVPPRGDARPCSVCGSPTSLSVTFCPSCGATLRREAAVQSAAHDRPVDGPSAIPTEGHPKPTRTSLGVNRND